MARLDALRALVEQSPADSRVRYMLALEMAGTADWEGALAQLREIIARDPAYIAAYYQAGQAAERLDLLDEARELYHCGVEAAHEAGDVHAERELQAALDVLG